MDISGVNLSGVTIRDLQSEFNIIEGGTITYYQNYTIHTFTENTTLTVKSLGKSNNRIEVFLLGGGGGGGMPGSGVGIAGGGGGGGGAFYKSNAILPVGQHDVIIGQGGVGGNNVTDMRTNTAGGNTQLYNMIALGGGAGGTAGLSYTLGGANTSYYENAMAGGNGGGAHSGRLNTNYTYLGGLGLQDSFDSTQPQANEYGGGYGSNRGGAGYSESTNAWRVAGGGACFSFLGNDGTAAYTDGNKWYAGKGAGGRYNSNPIVGSTHGVYSPTYNVYFLGGGGGGAAYSTDSTTRGIGGTGGGGAGGVGVTPQTALYPGVNGTNGYGGGGGGGTGYSNGGANASAGNGGSGVVIIRYRNS